MDERSFYAPDGIDLLDSYGPLHNIAIDGSWVNARAHTRITYGTLDTPGTDPTVNGPKHLEVERTVAASLSAATTPTDETDVRTTRTAYGLPGDATGWTLRTPMRETTVIPGGTDIVRETVYNPTTGLVNQSRMPSAAGNATAVGTTKNTYYTAGTRNDANCVNSAWINLICKIEPGSQPTTTGLPKLPVAHHSYDWLGRATTVTETVIDSAGATQTRTSTTEFQNSGWSPRQHRTLVTGTVGTAAPAVITSYDPTSGLPTTVATDTTPTPGPGLAGTTTTGYDDFGRTTTFTDADAATTTTSYTAAGRVGTVTTKRPGGTVIGTTSYGYNAGTERRGLTTSITDSALTGAITGTYDGDGELTTQTYPTGMTQTVTRDPSGDTTRTVYTKNGVDWLNDAQSSNIHGQWRWNWRPTGTRLMGYDHASRLNVIWDIPVGSNCVARTYSYDVDSNRTASSAWPAATDGACPPPTTPTTTTHAYDAADRLLPQGVDTGLTYDAFGRITTLPAPAAGGTATTNSFHVTDMVASQAQGTATRSWTLDPAARLREAVASGTTTRVNHYDDASSDSPAWIDENKGAATFSGSRHVAGLDGLLAATVSITGTSSSARWQLVNLHGDIVKTAADNPNLTTPDGATLDADEFGVRQAPTARYAWLGANQRSSDALGAVILMGVRLYAPSMGRFVSIDPIPDGSANPYDYAGADPVNRFDFDGRCWNMWSSRCRNGNSWQAKVRRVSVRHAKCAGIMLCTSAHYGTVTATGCYRGSCASLGYSRVGGRSRWAVGAFGVSQRGGSLMWSQGKPTYGRYSSAGGCHRGGCVGYSRSRGRGSFSIGIGTRGGYAGRGYNW